MSDYFVAVVTVQRVTPAVEQRKDQYDRVIQEGSTRKISEIFKVVLSDTDLSVLKQDVQQHVDLVKNGPGTPVESTSPKVMRS